MTKELTFNVKSSQKLDDGDTALVEEYTNVDKYDVADIMAACQRKATYVSYVTSFTITVEINR